jgi:hypothetical protein
MSIQISKSIPTANGAKNSHKAHAQSLFVGSPPLPHM